MKKVTMKGKVPIDEHFTMSHASYHVLEHGGKVYSATLNQTNVNFNNNKFYIIQVLQHDSNPNSCFLFTRWGRVGVPGQKSCLGPWSIDMAILEYNKKHREKSKKGDYREVELNYDDDEEEQKKS